MFKRYVCIKQNDSTDCAAACLATVAKVYGLKITVANLLEIAGTNVEGTSAYGIIMAAEKLGFLAKGVKATEDELANINKFPIIAHINKNGNFHYVVIHRIKGNKVIVADPEEGVKKYILADFVKVWSSILILISVNDNISPLNFDDSREYGYLDYFKILFFNRDLILKAFAASLAITLLGLISAFYFQLLIDNILPFKLKNSLNSLSLLLILLMLIISLLNFAKRYTLLILKQKLGMEFFIGYFRHILKLPINFFETRTTGDIISRINDTFKIVDSLSETLLETVIDLSMIIVSALFLINKSPRLFFIYCCFLPIQLIIVLFSLKPLNRLQRMLIYKAASIESFLVEAISGIATIKALNAENIMTTKLKDIYKELLNIDFKIEKRTNMLWLFEAIITNIRDNSVFWIGALLVILGTINSIGDLITFSILLNLFSTPLNNLFNLQSEIQGTVIATKRLLEVLSLEPEIQVNQNKFVLKNLEGKIEIKDLNFSYNGRGELLKNITLDISKGEKVAIIGESGSGKSTLVKLLMKYYAVQSGSIKLDAMDIKDIDTNSLRQKIGYMPQDPLLINGTVLENLELGNEKKGFEEVVKMADRLSLTKMIEKPPLRYDSLIGEKAVLISHGERQRIALARVMLKNPSLIILDEATSSLDISLERNIFENILEMSQGKTLIAVTHRLNIINLFDKIVFMDNGAILAVGQHDELFETCRQYRELWRGQDCLKTI